jgi:cysteine-rich repeat protein
MNRKRGKKESSRKAQVATEHMGLAGIVLISVLLLAYFISTGAHTGGLQVKDAIKTLDDSVEGLSNIGGGSADTVTISSPRNVENVSLEDCEIVSDSYRCNSIKVIYSDQKIDYFNMKYYVWGSLEFLKTAGIHHVTLYHDGNMGRILFIECGDGGVNGWEECEYCNENEDCVSENCIGNVCAPKNGIENDCNILRTFYTGTECGKPTEEMECFCKGEYCGDGIVQSGFEEECDFEENPDSCGPGLICNNNCICVDDVPGGPPSVGYCGNGIIEGDEECDWPELDGNECTDFLSYTGGVLGCYREGHANECEFDFGFCTSSVGSCGDGIVGNSPGEECDDNNNLNNDGCDEFCKFEDSDPCDSIVSYWKFDEGFGTTLHDSNQKNDGLIYGGAEWETIKTRINGCNSIYYPGFSSYSNVSDSDDFNFAGDFSIELWAYLEGGSSVKGPLFVHKNLGGYPPSYWSAAGVAIIYDSNVNEILAFVDDGGASWALSISVQKNKWQHIALSANKARDELFLCVSDDSDNINCVNSTSFTTSGTFNANEDIFTGPAGGNYDFTGYIDELAVYDESMIKDRIREHLLRIEGGWKGYCGEGDCYTSHSTGYCGDGIKDGDEECDWPDLDGMECSDFPSYIGGVLNCYRKSHANKCEFNFDFCTHSGSGSCGDGIKDGDEECDGLDFGEESCYSLGYVFGSLECNSTCGIIPRCWMPACWDTIDNDDDILIDYGIENWNDPGCFAWDDFSEKNGYLYCGDGTVTWPEECEDKYDCDWILGGEVCSHRCECVVENYCGDGIIGSGEECDMTGCTGGEICRYCVCVPQNGRDPPSNMPLPPDPPPDCNDLPNAQCAVDGDCPEGSYKISYYKMVGEPPKCELVDVKIINYQKCTRFPSCLCASYTDLIEWDCPEIPPEVPE